MWRSMKIINSTPHIRIRGIRSEARLSLHYSSFSQTIARMPSEQLNTEHNKSSKGKRAENEQMKNKTKSKFVCGIS